MENLCASFTLFGASHWVLMLLAIITAVTLVFVMKNFNDKKIKTSGWGLVGVMLGLTVLEFVGRLIGGGEFFESLPLDPVNIFVFLLTVVLCSCSKSIFKVEELKPLELSIGAGFENPVGINLEDSTLSWKLPLLRDGIKQGAYRIQIAKDKDFKEIIELLLKF